MPTSRSILERIRHAFFATRRTQQQVTTTPDSLEVTTHGPAGAETLRLRWDEIDRLIAFKRDQIAVDLLCLQIEAGASLAELSEETDGWDELLRALPRHLPGALGRDDILRAIVQPPFAECRTVVFQRGPSFPSPP